MIFATVGTQLPFPRLAGYLEALAKPQGEAIVFQSADPHWQSAKLVSQAFMTPDEIEAAFVKARVVVAHAGIGTVLTTRRLRKPLIVVPRRHSMGEHRNDHQMATAKQLCGTKGIAVATDLESLTAALHNVPNPAADHIPQERARLINEVRAFLAR